jgi:subtilisin family serine protease
VLNLSFAVGVDEPAIRKAVQYAVDRDVVVVAAAGNEARSQPGLTWYPAAYDGVLAVAGVDAAGQASAESNRGAWVDVAAPGEGLTAPSAGGEGFVAVKGTSFATAVVSGVAALVRARYPDMPAAEVVRRIEATAVSSTGGRDERTGAGIVDPYLALTGEAVAPPASGTGDGPGSTVRVEPVPEPAPLLGPGEAAAAGLCRRRDHRGPVRTAGRRAAQTRPRRSGPPPGRRHPGGPAGPGASDRNGTEPGRRDVRVGNAQWTRSPGKVTL